LLTTDPLPQTAAKNSYMVTFLSLEQLELSIHNLKASSNFSFPSKVD
jgi:hypothetical protein